MEETKSHLTCPCEDKKLFVLEELDVKTVLLNCPLKQEADANIKPRDVTDESTWDWLKDLKQESQCPLKQSIKNVKEIKPRDATHTSTGDWLKDLKQEFQCPLKQSIKNVKEERNKTDASKDGIITDTSETPDIGLVDTTNTTDQQATLIDNLVEDPSLEMRQEKWSGDNNNENIDTLDTQLKNCFVNLCRLPDAMNKGTVSIKSLPMLPSGKNRVTDLLDTNSSPEGKG